MKGYIVYLKSAWMNSIYNMLRVVGMDDFNKFQPNQYVYIGYNKVTPYHLVNVRRAGGPSGDKWWRREEEKTCSIRARLT